MSLVLEATKDFYTSLSNVDTLIAFAQSEDKNGNQDNRILFLKLSIVTLVTRFQVFVENALDDFIFALKKDNVSFEDLPLHMRLNSLRIHGEQFNIASRLSNRISYDANKFKSILNHVEGLAVHFKSDAVNEHLNFKCKYPLGKTGKNELIDLFCQLEGIDIFENSGLDIGAIDSILQNRHLIIHQDIVPSLTEGDVCKYQAFLKELVKYIDKYLSDKFDNFKSTTTHNLPVPQRRA